MKVVLCFRSAIKLVRLLGDSSVCFHIHGLMCPPICLSVCLSVLPVRLLVSPVLSSTASLPILVSHPLLDQFLLQNSLSRTNRRGESA